MAVQLRPSVLQDIHKALNNTKAHLNVLDFSISQGDGNLTITYNYNTDYFIRFTFTNQEEEHSVREETRTLGINSTIKEVSKWDHLISGTMAPGNLVLQEQFEFHGTRLIQHRIQDWMNNLWEDLSAHPAIRELNQQKKVMNDFLKQFSFEKIPDGEKHFSQEEMDGLKQRLKKVEDQLADELKKVISDKTKLKKELNDLQKEFATLKQTMPHLTKKGWFRSMVSKLYIWGAKKENQQIIKATATYGKAFLEAAKDSPS